MFTLDIIQITLSQNKKTIQKNSILGILEEKTKLTLISSLCKILNFPPLPAIFDGLGTAGEASDSLGTTVQCFCEVVLWNGVIPRRKK